METSKKSKVKSKPKTAAPRKAATPRKAAASGKVTRSKAVPSEEEIRAKAKEIYHERIQNGEYGTAEEDWLKAEELLANSDK